MKGKQKIEILGYGCSRCANTDDPVRQALDEEDSVVDGKVKLGAKCRARQRYGGCSGRGRVYAVNGSKR